MEMIEFDRGNFRVPGHRVSKSLGHRREDLSRTILSARRNSPVPQREQNNFGKNKSCGREKRDFVVPTGTDCFARRDCERVTRGTGKYKKRLRRSSRVYTFSYIGRMSTNDVDRATRTNIPDLLRYTIFQSRIINANGCHRGDAL